MKIQLFSCGMPYRFKYDKLNCDPTSVDTMMFNFKNFKGGPVFVDINVHRCWYQTRPRVVARPNCYTYSPCQGEGGTLKPDAVKGSMFANKNLEVHPYTLSAGAWFSFKNASSIADRRRNTLSHLSPHRLMRSSPPSETTGSMS